MAFAQHMSCRARSFLLGLGLVLNGPLVACGGTNPEPTVPEMEYVPGELLTQLHPELSDSFIALRLAEQGLSLVLVTGVGTRVGLVRVPVGGEEYWAGELIRQGLVLTAERNAIVHVSSMRRPALGHSPRRLAA